MAYFYPHRHLSEEHSITFARGLLVATAGGENGEALLVEGVVCLGDVEGLLLIFALEVGGGVAVGSGFPAWTAIKVL